MRFLAQSIVAVLVLGVAACGGRAGDSPENTSRSTNTGKDDEGKDDSEDDAAQDDGGVDADDRDDAEEDDADDASDDSSDDAKDDGADDDAVADDDSSSGDAPSGTSTGGNPNPTATGTATAPPSMTSVPPVTTGPIAPPPGMVPGKPLPGGETVPAEGCGEATRTVGTNYCEDRVQCTNDYISSYCSGLPDGTWECSCSSYYTSASYQLTGVTEETACGPVLEYCRSGNPPVAELGEPVCEEPQAPYFDTSYCSSNQVCRSTGAISDTVSSLGFESRYAQCSDIGTGALSCSCSDNTTSAQYELTGATLDTACSTVMDLCSGAVAPEFAEEATCTQVSRTEGTNQCDIGLQCDRSAMLADGQSATSVEYKSAYCSATNDVWACNCSTPSRYLSFQLTGDTLSDNRCMGSLNFCETTTPIEPAGEITCSTAYQSVSGDYCSAQSTCVQQADVDGVSIGLLGSLYTSCSSDGAGGFSCSCNSDTESATIATEGEDLWAACTNAAKLCPDVVQVNIGTGNTSVGPGRPGLPIGIATAGR